MSYDLGLYDQVTGGLVELELPHHMKGGTYQAGGCDTASINITYNYAEHFQRVLGLGGIRSLYGMSGRETIPILESAIMKLGDDVDADYWKPTEGNAKLALQHCLELARMAPDGVWDGD